jgi:autotransporter-associated beta strand protein
VSTLTFQIDSGTSSTNTATYLRDGAAAGYDVTAKLAIVKTGAGTLDLSSLSAGNQGYGGGLTVNGGTLTYNSTATIAGLGSSNITLGGGTLNYASNGSGTINRTVALTDATTSTLKNEAGTITVSSIISGSGSLTKSGAGTLILSGVNTFSGGLTLDSGTIRIANDSAPGSGTLTLNGGTFAANTAAQNRNVSCAITIGGDVVFGDTTLNSTITSLATVNLGAAMRTLTINNTQTQFSAVTGTGGIIKEGPGILKFQAGTTFSGGFTLNNGTVLVNDGAGLGNGTLTLNGGNLATSGGTARSLANAVVVGGNVTVGQAVTNTGNITLTGSMALGAATRTFTTLVPTQFNGTISSTGGGLTKDGAAKLTLVGNSSYTGTTTLTTGTLALGGSGTSTIPGNVTITGGELTYSNATSNQIADSANLILTSGNFAMGNHSDTINSMAMSGGNLSLSSGTLTLAVASSFTGGNIAIIGATSGRINTSAATTLGNTTFDYNHSSLDATQGLVLGGNLSVDPASVASFANLSVGIGLINLNGANRTVDVGAGSSLTLDWAIINSASNSKGILKEGAGTLNLNQNNTFDGGITLHAGTLDLNHAGATGTGTLTLEGGILDNTSGSAITLSNNNAQIWNADFTFTGTDDLNLGTGNVSLGSSRQVTVSDNTLTVGGVISGAHGLTKLGVGTLAINGSNTYTGSTVVSAGTLATGGADKITDASAVVVAADGTLALGGSETVGSISGAGNFSLADTLTTGGDDSDTTVSGIVSGAGGLTKTGSGTLSLSGANTFSGATNITEGTLAFAGVAALGGTSGVTLSNGAGLAYSGATDTFSKNITVTAANTGALSNSGGGVLTLAGTLTKNGSVLRFAQGSFSITGGITGSAADSDVYYESGGTISLNATNTYNGPTYILNGTTVNANAAGALPTDTLTALTINDAGSSLVLGADQTIASLVGDANASLNLSTHSLTINTTTTTTYSGSLSGSGDLVKSGSGTQTLAGDGSAFTGTATINAGTLKASAANALGGNSTLIVNTGGSLLVTADEALGAADITLASATTGNGTVASLAFTGTYNGTVGALTLTNDSVIDLGEGSIVIHFASLAMNAHTLDIYNWTGTTLWEHGDGNNTDQFYVDGAVSSSDLSRISFYSSLDTNSFVGSGYQILSGTYQNEIIPVPEPATFAAAFLLLAAFALRNACQKRLRSDSFS